MAGRVKPRVINGRVEDHRLEAGGLASRDAIQGGPAREGFPAGDVAPITATDNRRQGAALNAFFRSCNVNQDVSSFVLPIDNALVPTFGYCVVP